MKQPVKPKDRSKVKPNIGLMTYLKDKLKVGLKAVFDDGHKAESKERLIVSTKENDHRNR